MTSSPRSIRTFRIHLALTAATVTLGFALVVAAAMFVPLFAQLDRGDLDQKALAGISIYLIELHTSYWPVVAGTMIASVVSGLLLFNRMTAPLERFSHVFEAIGRGENPAPILIRTCDYLQEEVPPAQVFTD